MEHVEDGRSRRELIINEVYNLYERERRESNQIQYLSGLELWGERSRDEA